MNAIETQLDDQFYVTGGTLSRDALCYVTRKADQQLYDGLRRGQLSYVLTARQMGKSSLMVRTASRLRDEGVGVAVLDLTAIGQNLTAEQWYGGLLTQIAQQLGLEEELEEFWDGHSGLGPLQRWMEALKQVVLARSTGRVVIFIDEIDAVRSLPFSTDEFFAGIREFYNHRTEDRMLERLSFCLLGVAAPSDLIRDTRMTPFNIGQRIELHDFSETEARALSVGLGGEQQRALLLERILYWTGGHPYLTQRLCQAVAEHNSQSEVSNPVLVDRLCSELFFAMRAREQDDNLLFVRERMMRSEVDLAGLLLLYAQVQHGRTVEDDETNSFVTVLKLSGITRIEDGRLRVRNRIYDRVFDQSWVAGNMPDVELRRQQAAYRRGLMRAAAIAAVILVAMAGLVWQAIRQRNLARTAEEINRQQLYAAHMNLAARDWQDASVEHMRDMLALQMPHGDQADLRGFDWYLLWALAHPDRQTIPLSRVFLSVAFSPDLRMFATSDDQHMSLWDMATGKQSSVTVEPGFRGEAKFSPDGKVVAVDNADNSICLWDLSSGHELRRLKGNTARLQALAFSADGKMLAAAGEDHTARLWDVGTGDLLATLKGHTNIVSSVDFSPDASRVVTGSLDETVRVWEAATGKELMTLKEHTAKGQSTPPEIWRAAFSPDGGRILGIGNFTKVAVWDAETGQELPALEGHRSWIKALAVSRDGRLMATGGGDRIIRLWDVSTWSITKTLIGHGNQIIELAFSNDGKTLASASYDKTVKLWDVEADANPFVQPGVFRVAYAPDGNTLASANGKILKLLETNTWKVIASFEGHTDRIRAIAYSPDGKLVASGSDDKTIRLWDIESAKERVVLKGHTEGVWGIAFSPHGKLLATASLDKTVRLWEVSTGEQVASLEGHLGDVQRLAFSPDGNILASASVDTTVRLWDVAMRRELAVLEGHTSHASDLAFSPDGKLLATTSLDSTIKLWDVATRRERATLKGHAGNIYSPAFSPDGKRLATAGQDSTVRLWDVDTGQELAALRHQDVWSVAFSPDGKHLASAGGDGRLRVWRAATEQEVLARRSQ